MKSIPDHIIEKKHNEDLYFRDYQAAQNFIANFLHRIVLHQLKKLGVVNTEERNKIIKERDRRIKHTTNNEVLLYLQPKDPMRTKGYTYKLARSVLNKYA